MIPPLLADDQMCIGCGSKNPRGLHLAFDFDPAERRIRTRWTPLKEHQGFANIVHGGMTGLVLDELMGNLLWKLKRPSVTAELTVKFLRPARVGEPLDCEVWIVSERKEGRRRVFHLRGIARRSGKTVAEADARCVQIQGNPD